MGNCASNPGVNATILKKGNCFHAIFIGPPGVGKGTQCDLLKKKVDYAHISTGDLVRAEIKNQSELGNQIKAISEAGGLVSDNIICNMLINHVKTIPANKPWIIDGFPRTLEQANFLKAANLGITHVIELVGNEDEIIERLSGRLFDPVANSTYHKVINPPPADIADRCIVRKDDEPATIKRRFEQYKDSAAAINSVYSSLLKSINTQGKNISQIEKDIDALLL